MTDATVWEFDALGTAWDVTLEQPVPQDLKAAITAELDRIDRQWSRFRDDSTVADMAAAAGRFAVPPSDQPVIDLHRKLYEVTDGMVTPMVGQTLDDAGYDSGYSLTPATAIAEVPLWDDVLAGWQGELDVVCPTLIDIGATGKGFAVDRVTQLVRDHGFDEFLVNGSGDIRAGKRSHRIALEHPVDQTKAIGVVVIEDNAICASASNRRAWAEWHHIVDPRTGAPTREVLATWAIAEDTMTADGLATALFFASPQKLLSHFDFDYVVVRSNGTVEHSHARELELFL